MFASHHVFLRRTRSNLTVLIVSQYPIFAMCVFPSKHPNQLVYKYEVANVPWGYWPSLCSVLSNLSAFTLLYSIDCHVNRRSWNKLMLVKIYLLPIHKLSLLMIYIFLKHLKSRAFCVLKFAAVVFCSGSQTSQWLASFTQSWVWVWMDGDIRCQDSLFSGLIIYSSVVEKNSLNLYQYINNNDIDAKRQPRNKNDTNFCRSFS